VLPVLAVALLPAAGSRDSTVLCSTDAAAAYCPSAAAAAANTALPAGHVGC
jgi:hypothetical protein